MKHKHPQDRIKKMCDILGEDFDSPVCQAMINQIDECPSCKIYYDTVKKTVLLCKENDCPESLPDDVNNRLLKILDLDKIKSKKDPK